MAHIYEWLIFDKVSRQFSGERIVFSINDADKIGQACAKNQTKTNQPKKPNQPTNQTKKELQIILLSYTKINSNGL